MKRKTILIGIIGIIVVLIVAITLGSFGYSCKSIPMEEQEETTPPTTQETTTEETEPPIVVKEEVVEEIINVNAPEIKDWKFDQKTRTYTNKAGKIVAIFVKNALKIGDKWKDAIGIAPWELRNILIENAEKGIFKCPWPFDLTENKGIEVVELVSIQVLLETGGIYIPNDIGIKYSEPVNLYAPFDAGEFAKEVWEKIPDKEGDPDFNSGQPIKGVILSTDFLYKLEETGAERSGNVQYRFIDWKPLIELGEVENVQNEGLFQDIIGEVKVGDLLGVLLPQAPDFDFLDFATNEKIWQNPGQFQAVFSIYDFFDDIEGSSSLERVLRLGEENQEITVFVWPDGQNNNSKEKG